MNRMIICKAKMQNLFRLLFGFALSEQETPYRLLFFQPVKLNHCKKVCVFNEERHGLIIETDRLLTLLFN